MTDICRHHRCKRKILQSTSDLEYKTLVIIPAFRIFSFHFFLIIASGRFVKEHLFFGYFVTRITKIQVKKALLAGINFNLFL